MRKYIYFLRLAILEFLAYRIRIILSLLDNLANPLILIFAVSGAKSTNMAPPSDLIGYYISVLVFLPFLWISVEETIGEMTFTGEINNFLIKPVSFYKWMLVREIGKKITTFLIVTPLVIVFAALTFFTNIFQLNYLQIIQALMIVCISFFLCFNIGYTVGLFTFWFDEVFVIRNIREVFVSLLGGVALPYYFFPKQFLEIIFYSPFPYMITWPGRVIRYGMQTNEVLIALSWLVISFFCAFYLWGKVVNKYSNVGS